ncbi:hypothetical protein [Bythopirellula goksoeyrii]|uniref:Uncharacterized protein n=1 Tax=Bythopirellula goksoeyrii TaxID=1400387 RepID=A0A5B9QEQ7_9BACT|nr:hypothetical protein [Bythopirellula goksoeyrii]QEG36085.1 hypothetical protein Pr1d_33940 [Bythopirellula goksoeyrii]
MQQQRTIDFEATGNTSKAEAPQRESVQVATETSLPPPPTSTPPLVRPDRQIVYENRDPEFWPSADSLHNLDTITVDRIHEDIEGPSHRLVIQREDIVEARCGPNNLQRGTVVDINHARQEVLLDFGDESPQWLAVGLLYPVADSAVPCVADSSGNAASQDPHLSSKKLLAFLAASPGTEFTPSELRRHFSVTEFDSGKPLANPVHTALKELRDKGRIHVTETRFGEPRFAVLALPDLAAELTLGHCPQSLSGAEIRYLLRKHGQQIAEFALRWGFTQKHVREVFDRGLADPHVVYDWLEAILTP